MALAYEQEAGRPHGPIRIASLALHQYRPEEISVDVDSENITLHGQHRSEDETGYVHSEFKKVIKIPEGVNPTSVTSRVSQDGGVLLLEGFKRVEEKAKDDHVKYTRKLDLSGFKPEEIKVQRRGQEMTVIGEQRSKEGRFLRNYSRRIQLPHDADPSSVKLRLSKEGLLVIEVSRDPALLPTEREIEVTTDADETQPEDEAGQACSKKGGKDN